MPALVQVCIVIATIGLLAIALMTLRMMSRVNKATGELSQLAHALRESAVRFDLVTHEARALLASLRDGLPPALRIVERCDVVSRRAAALSSSILEEFELPVLTAAALARGVRWGTSHFLNRLMDRFSHHDSPTLGGNGS